MKKAIALLLACLLCFGAMAASAAPAVTEPAAFKMTREDFQFYLPQLVSLNDMTAESIDAETFVILGDNAACTIFLLMDGDQVMAVEIDAQSIITEKGGWETGSAIAAGCIVPLMAEDDTTEETITRLAEDLAVFLPKLNMPAKNGKDLAALTTAADYPIYYASTLKDAQLCVTVIMYPKGTVVTLE